MKWKRAGKYAIETDGWTICKCFVSGTCAYMLYKGDKLVGKFETADKAKEAICEKV